jgi:NAD(P)-dependent dehydrogenase (short-subunit alcohol dehydrogenase family)
VLRELAGKIAIVTGGASGIGKATAESLSLAGATAIIADINFSGAWQVADDLRAEGHRAEAHELDIADQAGLAAFAEKVIADHGGVDIVVNNAVRMDPADGKIADIPGALWTDLLAANVVGPALLSRHVIPSMIERGGGAFVHIASVAGIRGEDTRSCYGTAKAALIGLSRSIAVQYGKQGIVSNCIAPGLILTPAAAAAFDLDMLALFKRYHMTRDIGLPEEVAATVRFLVSSAARFITGQTIVADGGFSASTPTVAAFRQARD